MEEHRPYAYSEATAKAQSNKNGRCRCIRNLSIILGHLFFRGFTI